MVFQEMIKNKEIPSYKKFTHEPEKKRQRRLAKENREAVEAEELKKELGVGSGDVFIVFRHTFSTVCNSFHDDYVCMSSYLIEQTEKQMF